MQTPDFIFYDFCYVSMLVKCAIMMSVSSFTLKYMEIFTCVKYNHLTNFSALRVLITLNGSLQF